MGKFLSDVAFAALLGFLTNNILLVYGVGTGLALKLSRRDSSALLYGLVMLITTVLGVSGTYFIDRRILNDYNMQFLRPLIYIAAIAVLLGIVEALILRFGEKYGEKFKKIMQMGILNSATLGILLIGQNQRLSNFGEALLFAIFATFGYIATIGVLSCLRERIELSNPPDFMRGIPIILVTLGLLALAFMGFTGLSLPY